MNTFKTVAAILTIALLQACASGGGIMDAPAQNDFKWNPSHSTALNIINAIDVDYVEEDRDISDDLKQQVASSGLNEAVFAAVDGLSYAKSVHSLGTLSNSGALGLGLASFLFSTDEEFHHNSYLIFWLPYNEGDTLEKHIPFVRGEIEKSYNNLLPLHNSNRIDQWEYKGNTLKTKAHIWLDVMGKNRSMKVWVNVTQHGLVTSSGVPPTLRSKDDKWMVISAEIDRGGYYFDEMGLNLSENTFYFNYFSKPKKKHQPSYDPRVINNNLVYRFVKPINK